MSELLRQSDAGRSTSHRVLVTRRKAVEAALPQARFRRDSDKRYGASCLGNGAALERDLLQRDFVASRNEKWVTNVTYIRAWNGFAYLGFILGCYTG
jgi:transposase InsO family protein